MRSGLHWLVENQNRDGGWGSNRSKSNVSTTLLVWAALKLMGSGSHTLSLRQTESWLKAEIGSLDPEKLVEHIEARYGEDRTFSIPILTMIAICGCLGEDADAWKKVRQLPFELALLPHRWFERIHLPVVSYALPALIAIGVVRFVQLPTNNPLIFLMRGWAFHMR